MKLIKRITEGERIDSAIIGWKTFDYIDVKSLRISIYLKFLIIKIEFGVPTGKKHPSEL